MNAAEHRAEAEQILRQLAAWPGDALWAQTLATRALAHATMAGLPCEKTVPVSSHDTDNVYDPEVIFQGSAVSKRVECQRLAREEYTKRHAAELIAKLSEEH